MQGRNVKNLDCLLYLQNGQTEGSQSIVIARLQAPVYAEQIHTQSSETPIRTVSLSSILKWTPWRTSSGAISSLLPAGCAQNGKSNKRSWYPLAKSQGIVVFLTKRPLSSLPGFQMKLAIKLKMIVRIARIMARDEGAGDADKPPEWIWILSL